MPEGWFVGEAGSSGGTATDNFNRSNSTTSLGTASDGGTYAVQSGSVFGISSSQAYCVAAGPSGVPIADGSWIAYRDLGAVPITFTIDIFRSDTSGSSSIAINFDPATNSCYRWQYDSSGSFGSLARSSSDGHPLPGATAIPTAWTGGTTSLRLVNDGAGHISAWQLRSGVWVQVATITDTFPLTGTHVGFGTNTNSVGSDRWDNLSASVASSVFEGWS